MAKISPRSVNESCTACGEGAKLVESEFDDDFECGMHKACEKGQSCRCSPPTP